MSAMNRAPPNQAAGQPKARTPARKLGYVGEAPIHGGLRTLTFALLFAAAAGQQAGIGQEAPEKAKDEAAGTKSSLHLNLTIEGMQPAKVKVEIQTGEADPRAVRVIKRIEDVTLGPSEFVLPKLQDGDYYVYFSSPGHATQWQSLTVKKGKADPTQMNVKLFRKRYVVLRYVFNTSGGREFSGTSIKEGRAAVGHWGGLPYFNQDWQIWQRASYDEMFGDTPFLDFHRYSDGFGFAKAPEKTAFDDLKEAPLDARYKCETIKAEKGLTLFCRVEADRKGGLGYGKVVVEDVTETPPAGTKRIEPP